VDAVQMVSPDLSSGAERRIWPSSEMLLMSVMGSIPSASQMLRFAQHDKGSHGGLGENRLFACGVE